MTLARDFISNNEAILSLTAGDYFVVKPVGSNLFLDKDNKLAVWDGSQFFFRSPFLGEEVTLTDYGSFPSIRFEGVTWNQVQKVFSVGVSVASTTNIDLSSSVTSVDSFSLSLGDLVLVKNQSIASQNGIYLYDGSFLNRDIKFNDDFAYAFNFTIPVLNGVVNENKLFLLKTNNIEVGTDSIIFEEVV